MRRSTPNRFRRPVRTWHLGRSRSSPGTIAPKPGGCAFAEDPKRSASVARLIWDAAIDPRVIVADAHATDRRDPQRFDVFGLSRPVLVIQLADREELLIGDAARSVRISIARGSVLHGPVRLAYSLAGTDALDLRLLALRRLSALLLRGRLPNHLFQPQPRADRWARLIATLEASATAPSHRAVAQRLYGADIVAADWDGRSDFLRSRVRRMIAGARRLADGGYKALLRR
jgi:hypothetical protein